MKFIDNMNQLELFPTCDDNRIKNLLRAMKSDPTPSFSLCSVDKLEKAGRMYHVTCETVLKCFERVIEDECCVNSTNS